MSISFYLFNLVILTQTFVYQQLATMISRVIMITASSLCISGFYFSRKQKFYRQLFETLKDCQKYHMDYVEDIQDLPLNQKIILYGPVSSIDGQKVISSSFIKKQAETDRLWKMILKKKFNFLTAKNQILEVECPSQQILVFNLPNTQRSIKQNNFQQRAVIEGVGTCVYGSVKVDQSTKKYTIYPQLIIGNQRETLLSFLDKRIISLGNRFKILTGLGSIIFVGHAIYYKMFNVKSNMQQQIQNFK